MAQITTVALATRDTKNYVGSFTRVAHSFYATQLSANVTNGDRILIMTLPANSAIVGGSLRVTGTTGVTAIAHLQTLEPTSNNIALSPTSGAAAAPSIALNTLLTQAHSPITSVTGTRDVEYNIATGSFSSTVASIIVYVDIEYAFHP